jgi:hypothetical protein
MIAITGPALVLKSFQVDSHTGQVRILGRAPGLVAWFLSLIGLDATTELMVTPSDIWLRSASFFGEISTLCPIRQVATMRVGYAKHVQYLILAAITLPTILGPIIFVILYFLEKRIVLIVESTGGGVLSIAFKPSIIENVQVDVEKAKEVVGIINRHVAIAHAVHR